METLQQLARVWNERQGDFVMSGGGHVLPAAQFLALMLKRRSDLKPSSTRIPEQWPLVCTPRRARAYGEKGSRTMRTGGP